MFLMMGRGANTTTHAGAARPTVPVLAIRPGGGAYDQDDLIYFSGGHMPPSGLRFLNSGLAYISIHARRDGSFHVQRQVQRATGRVVGLAPLQLELLYDGADLDEATAVAAAARRELSDAGLEWDGVSSLPAPTTEGLSPILARLEEIRWESREHRGPALVDQNYVDKLRAEGWPERHIELAERARDTNPTAVGRETLPPRRTR